MSMNTAISIQYIQQLLMSWLNMDASNGFHFNSFDSNSISFCQLRQDSPLNPLLFFHSPFHQSCQYDRSINFSQVPLQTNQKSQPEDSIESVKDLDLNDEGSEQKSQGSGAKKGLKYLARLVLKLLKNKPLQQGEIVKEIQSIICKGKSQGNLSCKKQGIKQQKNVKRRIYDALNVMISAGILEKVGTSIKIKKRRESIEVLVAQPPKINDAQNRMQKKRELLEKLVSKKKALQYWIGRNRVNKGNQQSECLPFPLVFVMEEEDNLWISHLNQCLLMKSKELRLFSQTDVIECMHNSEMKKPASCPSNKE